MTKASAGGSAGSADDTDQQTIEFELSAEHALALSRAVEKEYADASLAESTPGSRDVPPFRNENAHADGAAWSGRWPLVLVAGIAVMIALGVAAHRATERHPSVPTMIIKGPISAPPAATPPAEPQKPPVRFRNPFDASEVFEFPPGTSATEARQSVAKLLLQRARERREAGGVRGNRLAPGTPDESAGVAQNSASRRAR